MKAKTLRLRDLKILDMFRFADEKLNRTMFGGTYTFFMDDITGYAHNYVTYNTINARGLITGTGRYMCDNPEVVLLGNARDKFPKRYADWYTWR